MTFPGTATIFTLTKRNSGAGPRRGYAYSYRHPRYTVIRARKGAIQIPAVYAVPKGDIETMEFVSNWVYLKQKDGTIDSLYDYWMLGGVTKPREPRWSIIRNVLGWIE